MARSIDINRYREIQRLRPVLKQIQQLSWEINNFEKNFPLENVPAEQAQEYLVMYETFVNQFRSIYHQILELDESKLD